MSLKAKLMDDLKTAMKEKDTVKKSTVTLVRSAIKQVEVDTREELNDEQVIEIIARQVKQRRDAIEEFKKGDRQDLVEQSEKELAILMEYLPQQLTEDEVQEIVKAVVEETGASSMKEMGKVMPKVIARTKGRADGKLVSQFVKEALS
ncbi:GatB/YqeY domain-containing protein [Vallitalea okinawensis]|uniref:GatB/YqeY domain-containing protein n=1 Tax=Vallitalea okinawensis TaxID=2078660 RepID=UPI000CFBA979|nr:GatB/YqeY domain-containing protein [Vallitalea okinawensis]